MLQNKFDFNLQSNMKLIVWNKITNIIFNKIILKKPKQNEHDNLIKYIKYEV